MRIKVLPFSIFALLASGQLIAQQPDQQQSGDQMFTVDTPVNLDFEREEEVINTKKKKKPKKKVFYGIKTRKGFTKKRLRRQDHLRDFLLPEETGDTHHFCARHLVV
ncbi:MAG: hypothetical protein HC859_00595 [Bacteroidia bacterium]|nr:hypothetical protein [Bacteroidia bacterium]